jgi:anaerobic ribonucleoside-triphosphate reductase activating protein
MELRIAGYVQDSIVDGPGLRFSLFTQGCDVHCSGCQNPQTWAMDGGRVETVESLVETIASNPLTMGITLTGGEPFLQAEALLELVRTCKEKFGFGVWAYSGHHFEDIEAGAMGQTARDLLHECEVLVDGPFIEAEKSLNLRWRGSKNQRVIDVAKSLESKEVILREH